MKNDIKTEFWNEGLIRKNFKPRDASVNKTNFGHVAVLAGSPDMWGSAILAIRAAFAVGAGYVHFLQLDKNISPSVLSAVPEAMSSDFYQFKDWDKITSLIMGPGWNYPGHAKEVFTHLRGLKIPKILDASGLRLWKDTDGAPLDSSWILSPHEGEAAYMLDAPYASREDLLIKLQNKMQACVLLKGSPSLLFDGKRKIEIPIGNAALAKAGTGDVLSGILGGLFAQNTSEIIDVAASAAYIHAWVSETWVKDRSIHSMSASDLVDQLPYALKVLLGE